ncbi:MAG: EAL domain-containing protein [Gammaproteobacteria bacterium]|nr:EAL domain-containing protein [Gammaproteobacteria bacterium]MDP2142348.1 EAL domain-containing protein [Gammaproteobacteria bacterium]MDP2348589.1 EAL domain-containing protein [Gammaproteobacteria bacterium]
MNLSRRSLLVITPVMLLSFLVASLIVFEQTQNFVERQEQNRLNYAVSELSAVFNQYTTFTDSYLHSVTESHAFHEYLQASDEAYSELALVRSVEDSLRTFRQHRSNYLSVTIARNYQNPEISYYFELSDNPFSTISEPLADFAFSMFERTRLTSWEYLQPEGQRNTIVKAQLVDRYTFSSPLPSQLDNSVVVQLAIEPTEFNQLLDELVVEMNAQINIVSELAPGDSISAFTNLGENLYLQAFLPRNHLQVQMRPLAGWLALVSLLFAITASVSLHGLMRRYVTRPVSLLEQDLANVLAKRRTTIPERTTEDDEIGRLARTFRTLYEDLSNSYNETRRLSQHDNLTGLYNLGYITEMVRNALQDAQAANEQVALLYLDLDNFKFVNDKYGHRFGDELLQAFAKLLLDVTASQSPQMKGDQPALILPGRVAGDQFCLFVRHPLAFIITREIATEVQNLLADGLPFANARFPVTVSIGIAVYPEDGDSVSQLLSNADTAMYQAKLQGKNQVAYYSPALADKLRRRQELETALKQVNPDEEFRLVYMPLLNVRTDDLDGFEVLLRWDSPRFGNVEPDEFVPIAESCGVFAKIDEWVISTGLSSYPAIRNLLGREFKMSLNISSAQLRLSNLTEVLDRYAKRFGIAPHCIQLEITETVNIEYTAHASDFLNRLSSAGYVLALDDFGAGFTSLLRLVEYPIDMVKFDKNFIQQTLKRGNRQILKPLVELCHSNGMLVTMEGAESQEDINLLRTFDCDYIQGYFLGRPISLPDMEEAVRTLRQNSQASLL